VPAAAAPQSYTRAARLDRAAPAAPDHTPHSMKDPMAKRPI